MKWTVELKTTKEIKKNKDKFPIHFKDIHGFFDDCYILLKGDSLLVLLEIQETTGLELKNEFFIKKFIESYLEGIINIISFQFNIPIKIEDIHYGNPKRIKPSLLKTGGTKEIKILFKKPIDLKIIDILGAYNQIKNENNKALRFLMYYRLLECFARDEKEKVDELIRKRKIKMSFIKERRNPKSARSLVTYIRNKIHATKLSYSFPYKALRQHSNRIEKVIRDIIFEIIKESEIKIRRSNLSISK
ncbi:MAG: hypothetical protein ACE5J0_01940 [Candidatus Paceibacterales bacterium]